ncbi:SPOR domain-containing protein [Sutcliffiella horikoshii]|uniref:SPOR domain-containing protein n=1 Tax=Sutcliffiella horikoshii TaxID=79883 RepID=UPI00384C8CD6
MDNHQVKIKINGKENSYGYGKKKKKNTKEKGNPQQKDVPEKENFPEEERPIIIVNESAAAAEKKEEDFEWVLPEETPTPTTEQNTKSSSTKPSYIEDLRQLKKDKGEKARQVPFGKKKKFVPPSFSKQLLVSIGMAIGIGTCLGFLILGVMNMSESPLNPAVPTVAPATPETSNTPDAPAVSGDDSATISAQNISVLQAGAFSTMDGANAEMDRLKAAGFPAVAVGSEPTFVLMAVGQSVDGMKQIATEVQAKGFEPFAKEMALSEKTIDSLTQQDTLLIQEGQVLYNQLTVATASLLQGSSLDSSTADSLSASFEKVAAIKDAELTDATKSWKISLAGAYEDLQSYQESNNAQSLWNAQQKLLDATAFLY